MNIDKEKLKSIILDEIKTPGKGIRYCAYILKDWGYGVQRTQNPRRKSDPSQCERRKGLDQCPCPVFVVPQKCFQILVLGGHPQGHRRKDSCVQDDPETDPGNNTDLKVSRTLTYEEHIKLLLTQHEITVEWRDRTAARSWRRTRKVRLERVQGASTYAIALHEIGHVVGPQGGRRLEKEAQAWRWAQENAIEWTEGMSRLAARCIETYLVWCERKRGVWIPPKNHDSRRIAKKK